MFHARKAGRLSAGLSLWPPSPYIASSSPVHPFPFGFCHAQGVPCLADIPLALFPLPHESDLEGRLASSRGNWLLSSIRVNHRPSASSTKSILSGPIHRLRMFVSPTIVYSFHACAPGFAYNRWGTLLSQESSQESSLLPFTIRYIGFSLFREYTALSEPSFGQREGAIATGG